MTSRTEMTRRQKLVEQHERLFESSALHMLINTWSGFFIFALLSAVFTAF